LAAAARVMHVEPGPRNEKAKKKGVFKKVKSFFFGSKKREGKEVRWFRSVDEFGGF